MKNILTLVLIVSVALVSGCSKQDKPADDAGEPQTAMAPENMAVINGHCPMMGNKIDSGKVPAVLVRQFKGQSVGFCCAGCPASWDALTEAEKTAKLAAAKAMDAKDLGG